MTAVCDYTSYYNRLETGFTFGKVLFDTPVPMDAETSFHIVA
jgi:hypothetical protein